MARTRGAPFELRDADWKRGSEHDRQCERSARSAMERQTNDERFGESRMLARQPRVVRLGPQTIGARAGELIEGEDAKASSGPWRPAVRPGLDRRRPSEIDHHGTAHRFRIRA